MSVVGTDYIFECSGKNLTYLASTFNPNPVWYYRFYLVASFSKLNYYIIMIIFVTFIESIYNILISIHFVIQYK